LVGKHAINPANGDDLYQSWQTAYIDMSFGTAVMKCTPAHDPNDFALAKKYHLAMPKCMNDDGTMNESVWSICKGWTVLHVVKHWSKILRQAGVVDHIEEHMHQVGHSQRTSCYC
jgi:valyl-tRNA synthetase